MLKGLLPSKGKTGYASTREVMFKELRKYVNIKRLNGLEIGPLDAPLIPKKVGMLSTWIT